jgi:hypothetical protein
MELKLQPTIEIKLESAVNRVTRWVRHDSLLRSRITY